MRIVSLKAKQIKRRDSDGFDIILMWIVFIGSWSPLAESSPLGPWMKVDCVASCPHYWERGKFLEWSSKFLKIVILVR